MRLLDRPWSRAAALAIAATSGAALLAMSVPSRAQQNLAAPQVSAPATASSGADTRVNFSFAVPPGLQFQRNPRVRVTDAKGQLLELLPLHVTQGRPAMAGYRDLHTELYPPGVYQLQVEVLYAGPAGSASTLASSPTAMTVAAR